jgi:hypothetical protein
MIHRSRTASQSASSRLWDRLIAVFDRLVALAARCVPGGYWSPRLAVVAVGWHSAVAGRRWGDDPPTGGPPRAVGAGQAA